MKAFALAMLVACANHPSPLDPPPSTASPPRAGMPIVLDGRADEPAWDDRATRGAFEPDTEVRLLRAAKLVFVFVEVRDRDLAIADQIDVHVGDFAQTITMASAPTPMFARSVTGTIDDPMDEDVGWRFELAIPFAAFGDGPVVLRVARCDAATHPDPDRAPVCGQFAATIVPTAPEPAR